MKVSTMNRVILSVLIALGALVLPLSAVADTTALQSALLQIPPDITSTSYLIAPFDQLEITVQGQADLHQVVQVLGDGTINYPIVGRLKASGLTVHQLTTLIANGLKAQYNQPMVTVMVRETHTRKISIAGDVRAPGLYDYHPGMRLLEVIAMAGGSTNASELTQVTLITDNGTKSIPIDLVALVSNGDKTQNKVLSPGDMILFAPRDPAVSMIQVVGEVGKPGQFPVVENGQTIVAMLTASGGALGDAALSKSQIMHDGNVQMIDLSPLKSNLDDPIGKIRLYQGDTLLIPQIIAKYVVLGEVRAPSVYVLPDGEDVSASLALARAGGPTNLGDKKRITVVRVDPSGKRQLIALDMDKILKGDSAINDFNIHDGDILVVPARHQNLSVEEYINQVPGIYYATSLIGIKTH